SEIQFSIADEIFKASRIGEAYRIRVGRFIASDDCAPTVGDGFRLPFGRSHDRRLLGMHEAGKQQNDRYFANHMTDVLELWTCHGRSSASTCCPSSSESGGFETTISPG